MTKEVYRMPSGNKQDLIDAIMKDIQRNKDALTVDALNLIYQALKIEIRHCRAEK